LLQATAIVGFLGGIGLVLCTSSGPTGFTRDLPSDLPDPSTWETSTGFAELDAPRRIVEYQLFVGPRRTGLYEVVRYRIVVCDPEERSRSRISANEKLQWDVDGGGIRRFECAPDASLGASACRWTELAAGTPEFQLETAAILAVYGLHSRLLHERDAGSLGSDR
jgi:hypothetical protein